MSEICVCNSKPIVLLGFDPRLPARLPPVLDWAVPYPPVAIDLPPGLTMLPTTLRCSLRCCSLISRASLFLEGGFNLLVQFTLRYFQSFTFMRSSAVLALMTWPVAE